MRLMTDDNKCKVVVIAYLTLWSTKIKTVQRMVDVLHLS